MKVALLSDCYLPRLGGIEVQVHDLAAALQRAGHEVEVFTATPGRAGERHGAVEEVDGVPVHHLALRLPGDIPVNPCAPTELRRRLSLGGFDAAHVSMGVVSPFAAGAADAALDVGLPTAITWHCVLGVMELGLCVSGRVRCWADRGAALSAVSRMAARPLERLVPDARVAVIPNGIDVDRWRPPGIVPEASPMTVVTAMRLAPRKRTLPLLRVVARAEARMRAQGLDEIPWRLDVFGDGPQRRLAETYLRDRGLQHRVRLRGRVSREELAAAYQGAGAYVSPVRLEAFGIAALEARTAGLPVVGMAGSGVEEFVRHGTEGLLARNDRQLCQQLITIVADSGVRQAIRRHNAIVPPGQGWDHVVDLTQRELARAGGPRTRMDVGD